METRKLCMIGLIFTLAAPRMAFCAQQSQPGRSAQTTKDQLVSLSLTKVTLQAALQELGKRYGINTVCDVYRDDAYTHVARIDISEAPPQIALQTVAQAFQRDTFALGNITILRDHRWYLRLAQDRATIAQYGPGWLNWKSPGRVLIDRLDASASGAGTTGGGIPFKYSLPARAIHVEAETAPVKSLLATFSARLGWAASFAGRGDERKVCAYLHRVSPAQTLEALSFLLNAGMEVSIRQTDEQRKAEEALFQQYADERRDWQKLSDELAPDLLKALTPDQLAAMQRGGPCVPGAGRAAGSAAFSRD